jgi:hypothetical protein
MPASTELPVVSLNWAFVGLAIIRAEDTGVTASAYWAKRVVPGNTTHGASATETPVVRHSPHCGRTEKG